MEHIQKILRLELSNTNIEVDLNPSKAENKLLIEQKDKIEKQYQNAGRTISEQERKQTETREAVKTMESLLTAQRSGRKFEGTGMMNLATWFIREDRRSANISGSQI